jgi:hypothetical protein
MLWLWVVANLKLKKDWRNIARVYFKIEQLKITEQWETKN